MCYEFSEWSWKLRAADLARKEREAAEAQKKQQSEPTPPAPPAVPETPAPLAWLALRPTTYPFSPGGPGPYESAGGVPWSVSSPPQ